MALEKRPLTDTVESHTTSATATATTATAETTKASAPETGSAAGVATTGVTEKPAQTATASGTSTDHARGKASESKTTAEVKTAEKPAKETAKDGAVGASTDAQPPAKKAKTDSARRVARKKKSVRKAAGTSPHLPTWTYSPGDLIPDLSKNIGETIEVIIPAKYISPQYDRAAFSRQLWGSGLYTDDSDILSVLIHAEKFDIPATAPTYDLLATFKILPREDKYGTTLCKRYGFKSRPWSGLHDGCSIRFEKLKQIQVPKKGEDGKDDKEDKIDNRRDRGARYKAKVEKENRINQSEAWNHLSNCSIVFNLSNDPVLKYTTALVEDRGVSVQAFTSTRLQKETLYVETLTRRFQISCSQKEDVEGDNRFFTWAEVKKPFPVSNAGAGHSLPLPPDEVQIIHDGLLWSNFVWTVDGLALLGERYKLQNGLWRHNTCT